MIAEQLPPVEFTPNYNLEFTGECLALCYLAHYNDVVLQPRVETSLKRAYAMDDIRLRAYVSGGRPGYAIVRWDNDDAKRITIAIEGMRTFNQIRSLWNGYSATNYAPTDGVVYNSFQTFAQTIRDELLADPNFYTFWGRPGYTFTFTGFSLGAAVAELLGDYMKANNPRPVVKVVKFASPRVGDRRHVARLNRSVFRENWYFGRDPVDILPYVTPNANLLEVAIGWRMGVWFAQDPDATRIDNRGHYLDPFHVGGAVQSASYLREFTRPYDQSSAWYDHSQKSYRHAFMVYAEWYNSLAKWRFRYLEFNDENQWGLQFNNQATYTAAMEQLVSPQPDPVNVDCPQWTQLRDGGADAAKNDRPRLPIQNFDRVSNGTAIGGTWGDPEQPEVAPVSSILARPPAVFSRVTPGRRRG